MYGIYDVRKNNRTFNWGGSEWVVDGDRGICTYPGYWTKEQAIEAYRNGKIMWEEEDDD